MRKDITRYIDELEDDFLHGRIGRLRERRCPFCDGYLSFDVVKTSFLPGSAEDQRVRCGISIFCIEDCQKMLSHMHGFCPDWIENISDWGKFSQDLYQDIS